MIRKRGDSRHNKVPRDASDEEEEEGSIDARDIATVNAARLSLSELTEAADVSVRTVRYYITEGLLPPPEGAGPGSAYTQGHLDRLRLIQRLKETYLPLKEIRRRLSGLSDDDVRRLLEEEDERESSMSFSKPETLDDESLAEAREYLALLESRERYRTEPMSLQFSAASGPVAASSEATSRSKPIRGRAPRAALIATDQDEAEQEDAAPGQTSGLWHHISLGDEAELVISDRVYGRHRDRVDWLVRWARKVFG